MFKSFEQDILRAVSGKFNLLQGITLSTAILFEGHDWQATEYHECIHMELTDNSIFGYFQRLLLSLIFSPNVPQEHKKIYRTAFEETMKNSFMVHEGLATYRALAWYNAYSDKAEVYRQTLREDYKKALEYVLQLLPDYILITTPELQAGVHALCVLLGCYLLNAPIPVYYENWNLLRSSTLKYINIDSPDDRLKNLIEYKDKKNVLLLLLQEVQIIHEDLFKFEGHLDNFGGHLDNTISSLKTIFPQIPVCGFFERGELFLKMLKNWRKQLESKYRYGQYLFNDEIKSRLSKKPREVGIEKVIYEVIFANLNAGMKLNGYKEINLPDISTYLKRVSEIIETGDIPFIVIVANPTKEDIQITKDYKLASNTIIGSIFNIKIDELNNFSIEIKNRTIYNFISSLTELFESAKKLPKNSVIHYLNSYYQNLLLQYQYKFNHFYIIRIINYEDFRKSFHIDNIRCFFYYNNRKTAFCYYNENEHSFYFYIVNLMQKENIKRMLANKFLIDPKEYFCQIGNNEISMQQLALLAFWGLSL